MRSEPDFNASIKKGSQVLSFECFISDEKFEDEENEEEEGEYNEDSLIGKVVFVFW